MISNDELLRKATLTTDDFDGAGEAPLSVEQVREFIKLFSAEQAFLPDVRRVTANAAKWEESIVDFGGRITHSGTEATRLVEGDREKPSTGNVEISTVLLRAEVPVSDETLEDNVAQSGFANDLEVLIADQFGTDVEELLVNGDTSHPTDTYLQLLDGWLVQAQDVSAGGNVVDAATDGQDYQSIFKKLLQSIPNRFKRRLVQDGRFYVPITLEENYRDILSDRGTPLGDMTLTGTGELRYQGILIKGCASIDIADDDTSNVLLANRNNLYAGFRRSMTMETWRDPREGATSFVVSARVDGKIAVPAATSVATNVDVSI